MKPTTNPTQRAIGSPRRLRATGARSSPAAGTVSGRPGRTGASTPQLCWRYRAGRTECRSHQRRQVGGGLRRFRRRTLCPVCDQTIQTPVTVDQTTGREVLVVEDDPTTRDLLCRTLAAHHQGRAIGVENTDAAFCVLRENQIDLIVQDLFRPRGSGFDFLATLRSRRSLSRIPVIVVSGQGARYERHALDRGATAVLQKPVSRAELAVAADLVHGAARFREGARTPPERCAATTVSVAGIRLQPLALWLRTRATQPLRVWLKRLF